MKTTQEKQVSMEDLAELSGGDRRQLWQRVREAGLSLQALHEITAGADRRETYQRVRSAGVSLEPSDSFEGTLTPMDPASASLK